MTSPKDVARSRIDLVLRGGDRDLSLRELVVLVALFSAIYGVAMGSSAGVANGHWLQMVYSALKVPMLLGVTFALSVPSYFMLNSLAGLRSDVGDAVRAVAAAQAGVAVTLASLSPFTMLWYASSNDYTGRVMFNGAMFAVATAAGQVLVRRSYRDLIARNRRHRPLLRVWMVVYTFIAIQMAWVLRPFVGQPDLPTHFVRPGAWGNAYVVVFEMAWRWATHISR